MNNKVYLNDNWMFHEGWDDTLLQSYDAEGEKVRIPHTVKEVSFHYFDERIYQIHSTYQRQLRIPNEWKGKRLLLSFEGVAHRAALFINGIEVIQHHCGYTPFRTDISGLVLYGCSNLITIRVDSTKEAADYTGTDKEALFGGIFREVYLDVKHPVYMEHVYYNPTLQEVPKTKGMSLARLKELLMTGKILTAIKLSGQGQKMLKERRLFVCQFLDGKQISNQPLPPNGRTTTLAGRIHLWDTASPCCYEIRTEIRLDGEVIDVHTARIGFRHLRWRGGKLELNGRRLNLRGLIRRQSFPYVGEAMPESMQRLDANILKKELGVNAVRTANYPPSRYFLSGCDEEGILVFLDIPGQRNRKETMQNIEDVIRRDRNHPSIVLWGMPDFGELQDFTVSDDSVPVDKETAREAAAGACRLAHELDPSRFCAGIYASWTENAPEDVYALKAMTCASQEEDPVDAGKLMPMKPLLIGAFGRGMTKVGIGDSAKAQQDQMLYHARILDAAAEGRIAGSFGEAMTDYFGNDDSGHSDGLCRYGVMDAFRNPKMAAFLYAAQPGRGEVLALSDDAPGGRTYLLSNAADVRLYRDDVEIACYKTKAGSSYHNMRHGPILLEDWLGDLLVEQEGLTPRQNEWVKAVFSDYDRYGRIKSMGAKMAAVELEKIAHKDSRALYELYQTYHKGNATYHFIAENEGKDVAALVRDRGSEKHLLAVADKNRLTDAKTYDVAEVRVRALDENGGVLDRYDGILQIETKGVIELIGPRLISFSGGYCGFYVKTTGEPGKGAVRIRTMDMQAEEILFETKTYRIQEGDQW